jgi:3-methyladenine DNA glycosylase AlkC
LTPKGDEAGSTDFKDRISPSAIAGLAGDLEWAWPDFPAAEFEAAAGDGLSKLEMKGRVVQVADALAATLPDDFDRAAGILAKALERPGFDGWIVYPVDDYVARYGIAHPEVALPLMAGLTSRWSCEFAIRPFIEQHAGLTFEYFDLWIQSDDEHLRRLVSEGSRPRLPWGTQLKVFIEDPAPAVRLLDRLVDDPSPYVRKSVANHLNDISKDHPGFAVETASRWLDDDPAPDSGRRRWIVSHGLRSLVKAGDPDALRLLGYEPDAPVSLTGFEAGPDEIRVGEAITIEFTLTAEGGRPLDTTPSAGPSRAPEGVPVMVDYAIHHAGASSRRSPKVFKLKKTTLEPGVATRFSREHRIREVSVRRIHPGPHLIEVQVNGKVLATTTIEVTP